MPRSKDWKPVPLMDKVRRRIPAVDAVDPDECLVWPGALSAVHPGDRKNGYGHLGGSTDGVTWTATVTRVVLEHKIGRPLNPGMRALHTCDNRPCCNPHHLYEGTPKQNSRDMSKRGRSTAGERQPNAKLTEDQVRAIRLDTRSQRLISREYGIAQSAVSMIKARRRWGHVT